MVEAFFKFLPPICLKIIDWWLTTDEGRQGLIWLQTRTQETSLPTLACGLLAAESPGLVTARTGQETLVREWEFRRSAVTKQQAGPQRCAECNNQPVGHVIIYLGSEGVGG